MNAHKLDAKIATATARMNHHWRAYERARAKGRRVRAVFAYVGYRRCLRRYGRLSARANRAALRDSRRYHQCNR